MLKSLISAGTIGAWQMLASISPTFRLYLSSPKLLFAYFQNEIGELMRALIITSSEAVLGLLLAIVIATISILLTYWQPQLTPAIEKLTVLSQVVPVIVLAPLLMVIIGNTILTKIIMAGIICFFPILTNLQSGFIEINKQLGEWFQVMQFSEVFRLKRIYLKLLYQPFFTGLRAAAPLAVIGAIVAEFVGAKVGIGKNLFVSSIRLEPELMMSSLILSIGLGLTLYKTVTILENYLITWK